MAREAAGRPSLLGLVPPTRAETGIVNRRIFRHARWETEARAVGFAPLPLPLATPRDLASLWRCRVVVNLAAESYPDVGGALVLAAIARWVREGGIWVEIAGTSFHFGDVAGRVRARWPEAIDLLGALSGHDIDQTPLRLTPVGRALLGDVHLPRDVPAAGADGPRQLAAFSSLEPALSLVETEAGHTLLGAHRLGAGYLVRWGGGAQRAMGHTLPGMLLGVARHLADRSLHNDGVVPPRVVIDPVLERSGGGVGVGVAVVNPDGPNRERVSLCVEVEDGRGAAHTTVEVGDIPAGGVWRGVIPVRMHPRDVVDVRAQLAISADRATAWEAHAPDHVECAVAELPPRPRRFAASSIAPRRPDDFSAFWRDARAELATIAPAARWSPSDMARTRGVAHEAVRFESQGKVRLRGLLCRPARVDGPLPSVLVLPGYGGINELPDRLARRGYAALAIDVRGVGMSAAGFPVEGEGVLTHGLDSPWHHAYRGIVLDCIRALDILCARPDVDAGRIAVTGISQGGGLALIVAALDARVRAVVSEVPFLCDIVRSAGVARTEPFDELARWQRRWPDRCERAARTLAYMDVANFAPDVRCPTYLAYAPDDRICPVAGVRTAIGRLTGPLTLRRVQGGHSAAALTRNQRAADAWLRAHLAPPTSGR